MFSLDTLRFDPSAACSPSVTDMIRVDHSHLFATFHQYAAEQDARARKALADAICAALEIHATLEEEIVYPVLRTIDAEEIALHRAPHEHGAMQRLIEVLRNLPGDDARHGRVLLALMREAIHHVADEETVILPIAETRLSHDRLTALGRQMHRRRQELQATPAPAHACVSAAARPG